MKFSLRSGWRLPRKWGAAWWLGAAAVAVACGPEFPNSYYGASERELLRGPEGVFAAEIARLAPRTPPVHRAVRDPGVDPRARTLEIDIADVSRALAERGTAQPGRIVGQYETTRRRLEAWLERRREARNATEAAPRLELPAGLPAEFRLYLQGALAWHDDRWDDARAAWQSLLDLPAEERKYRGVWAAFMLGRLETEAVKMADRYDRAAVAGFYTEARRRLWETRAMVAAGAGDPLGLAAASLGWEARAAFSAGDFPVAIRLYLEQHAAGDETAVASLGQVAREAFAAWDGDLAALARNADSRRVITAYLVSCGWPHRGNRGGLEQELATWATALEKEGVAVVPEADRLAWVAYNAGCFALAAKWVALAPADAAEASWIRGKLALRRGNLEDGERWLQLAAASPEVGDGHRARIWAELSRVRLARDDFAGALLAAMSGGHWQDAAFVAERVMTVTELKAVVDAMQPALLPPWREREGWSDDVDLRWRLRHLLGRRLARAGKLTEADAYYPGPWRAALREYAKDLAAGFDTGKSAEERGRAFWRAAQRVRTDGMELLGTELDPDWAIWLGQHALTPAKAARQQGPAAEGGTFAPTPVELQRLETQVGPEKRFHYRYRAAELAWWAASLLPNDSDETARILQTAGGWLKARDPQAANPFYQALVIRCGGTALGRAAAAAHWFPRPTPVSNGAEL